MKILICDDESIVQDSLKFIITKFFDARSQIESAKSGRMAIEMAREFRPDLIIMDISMPGINGIDAMKEIREDDKKVLFVVLTAFDKFEYAKKAINIGVLDYLTKPLNRDRFIEVLKKANKELEKGKTKRKEELEIKEKIEAVVPVIESGLIYNIFLNETENIENYRSLLDIKESYGYIAIIEAGDELHKGVLSNIIGAGVKLQKQFMVFKDIVKENFNAIVGSATGNRVIICILTENYDNSYENRVYIVEEMRALSKKLESQLGLKFKVGIGNTYPFAKLKESFSEASNAVREGISRVSHINDIQNDGLVEESYPKDTEDALFDGIEKGDEEKVLFNLNEFLKWLLSTSSEINNNMRLKVLEIVMRAESISVLCGAYKYKFEDRTGYMDSIMSLSSKDELSVWLKNKIISTTKLVSDKLTEKNDNIIDKAKSIIEENFMKDISLNEISRKVNVSPYYFSKMFKESEDITYIDYLTNLRIDLAKKKLLTTDETIKEICHSVGYNDPNYFSRIFKNKVGMSPSEFKGA
ncbi:MAG: response regulator [Lachnospiraceae bacterium]|jgi:two-component system response regulator YesN|nr:response regulator [Lachnospiraceae bacterium]